MNVAILLPSLLLSLALLVAQDPNKKLYLRKTDGEVVSGSLIALDGDMVKLKVSVLGGSMDVEHDLGEFQPASAWRLELAADPPKNFEGHFSMARKAADAGLLKQAGNEARAALKTVEGKPDFAARQSEVRSWAATALEKMIATSVAAGDLKEARHRLKLLTTRLADQRSEEQLHAVAKTVEALALSQKQQKDEQRQMKMDQRTRDRINSRLEPIEKEVAKADRYYGEAVRKSNQTVASSNLCDKAIRSYRRAWQSLESLLKRYPDDKQLASQSTAMGRHMHDQAIRAALHAANMLTVQSDYKGAMDWAQRILAFEPDNAEAKQMVRTIQLASAAASSNWGWNWATPGAVDPTDH